jgi:hypothetical protein
MMKQCIEFAHFACRNESVREIQLHRLATVASAAKSTLFAAPALIDLGQHLLSMFLAILA